jgi:hypothetical protein
MRAPGPGQEVLIPNAVSWFCMWACGVSIASALHAKERVRDALIARGAVWTAHEAFARHVGHVRDEAQRRIDQLSEEEVRPRLPPAPAPDREDGLCCAACSHRPPLGGGGEKGVKQL